MIPRVPGPILEAVDGTFLVLLLFAFAATARYTARTTARDTRAGRWHPLAWSPESKAAWSLAMIFFGLILRVGTHWILRHATNHGLRWEELISFGQPTILASTVLTTWGIICWIRTVIPLRCGALTWVTAAIGAAAFGVYMAA